MARLITKTRANEYGNLDMTSLPVPCRMPPDMAKRVNEIWDLRYAAKRSGRLKSRQTIIGTTIPYVLTHVNLKPELLDL